MEKQRMKDIFKNINMSTKKITQKGDPFEKQKHSPDEIRKPSIKTKFFGLKTKVCRKLSFGSASHYSLEEAEPSSVQNLHFSKECFPLTCDENILPASGFEEKPFQSQNSNKNDPKISHPIATAATAKVTPIGENVQKISLRSPVVKILNNVLLTQHTGKVASSVQESLSATNIEKNLPENIVLEENSLHVPPVIATEDAPVLTKSLEKIPAASTTATVSVNDAQTKSKTSIVCKIELSRLVNFVPKKRPIIDKCLSFNLNNENENKEMPSVTYSDDFTSTNSDVMTESTQKSRRKVLKANKKSYLISPVNSNESDPDLSDSDPTYNVGMEKMDGRPPPSLLLKSPSRRSRSISTSPSSSSPHSDDNDRSTTPERKTRKRKRNPESWKFNTAKRLRTAGQSYVSVKTNKRVDDRSVKPPCNEKCRLKCSNKFSEEERKTYFDKFWSLKSIDIQRAYIRSCMIEVKPKYKYSVTENPRKSNNAFYFKQGESNERVCKHFFLNTLDISDRMLRTVRDKLDKHNFLNEDKRGKHDNHKKVDPTLVADIKSFIDSIPRIESHYTRATSTCEYISPAKTLTEIYQDFVEQQQKNGRPSGKYCNFWEIFKDTGLKFHQPIKDLCNLCRDYRLTRSEDLKEQYEKHQEEKKLSRKEKKEDRNEIDDNNICAVYDLEAILQAPFGKDGSFFYKSKMNCYNFTIAELAKKTPSEEESNKAYSNVYCYFWDETQGQKGSTEIATCVLNFLKKINDRSTSKSVKVTFYSDNCCGQNKNKFITTLYMYSLTQFQNIDSIIHKYLIKGHTQNENDNAHSLIEKEIQKYIKAEPIYTPIQYIPLIKSAKKTGKKFEVQTLTFEDFIGIKNLQTQWGVNFTKDTNRNPLTWNDVKMIKFCKEEQFKFYFKTSYTDKEYREVDVRAGVRKSLPMVHEIVLGKAYNKRFELKENQKRDLKSLIEKQAILPFYSSYYNDVI